MDHHRSVSVSRPLSKIEIYVYLLLDNMVRWKKEPPRCARLWPLTTDGDNIETETSLLACKSIRKATKWIALSAVIGLWREGEMVAIV